MNSLWPSKPANDGSDAAKNTTNPVDVADTGVPVADIGPELTASTPSNPHPARPSPQRNQLPPNPPTQPPPAAPNTQPADSLSLAQLRRIVSEFPRAEAAAYDFEYADTAPHAEEIDEWFSYQFWQFVRLNNAQRAYESQWEHDLAAKEEEVTWDEAAEDVKSTFIRQALNETKSEDSAICTAATGKLVYLVLGRWADTAGPPTGDKTKPRTLATPRQLAAIKVGVKAVAELGGIPVIWRELRNVLDSALADEAPKPQAHRQEVQDGLVNLMTIMYMFIQVVLGDPEGMESVRDQLLSLQPCLPVHMLTIVTKLRFFEPKDDSVIVPSLQVLLMLWKSILLAFGGTKEINETKLALRESTTDDKDKNTITASPLDYHVFRQEITSKYPAYMPPQSKIPLDADNVSLLPPLPNHPTRNNGSNGILPAPPGTQSGGGSILHQPVHIATPAPSPPPSPAVGGKGGKKQNYQTNQNFPFLYPPLDETSNNAGGKGAAGFQQLLVGRKWEGSDVPASILEAGELFSKRVRMTRATRQLWEQRQEFQKFERGWNPSESDNDDINELDLDGLGPDDDHIDPDRLLEFIENRHKKAQAPKIDYGPRPEDLSIETKRRLEAVEKFYKASLPQLQSLIIVLMKCILATVTASISVATFNPQAAPGTTHPRESGRPVWNRSVDSPSGTTSSVNQDLAAQTNDADFAGRNMEIEAKASSAIILLLLKWLKISHILKFEYLTQLLLDSNYLPLVLKLFAHQDVQQVVDSTADHIEHSFFHFCNQRAHPGDRLFTEPTEIDVADEESEDEAAPPPIKRRRSPTGADETQTENEGASKQTAEQKEQNSNRPEVDELGYPVNPLPKEPITDFSWRNFFALINYLRIMQKICKHKAHRNLLLVQYKSSNIIRKSLKIPQNELRLYTLKLFKNQVPYCGRKWRQSNMRVITAVYLHCRPDLRDEWLAGSDVDAEVEEALPLEQALRSLTHWFNVRMYPDQMAPEIRAALRDEQDFFKRELERLEVWNEVDVSAAAQNEGGRGEWEQHSAPGPSWG
ncbi:N1221-domain-containing protein [Xylariaceae sp. AK1471]|nr:N1221-domain-containing protein [Xylariaceae sp. AK1471]